MKYWVLLHLRTEGLEWKEIAQTFGTGKDLALLSLEELHPVTPDEVSFAFEKMERRGSLTADALRQFFSRVSRKIRRQRAAKM